MNTVKISLLCVVASALLLAGNLSHRSPSNPLAAYPQVQLDESDDPGGLFIIRKKWLFPTDPDNPLMDREVSDVLSLYGQ